MAANGEKYVTLMASMPALPMPFAARELPISQLGLAARVKLLDEDDAELLQRILKIMEWERIDMATDEAEVVAEFDALMSELESEDLRKVVRARFELRTVIAALRRRRHGEPPPGAGVAWGCGRFVDHIRRNWTRPHFGLRRKMPWLAELREFHDASDTLQLEHETARLDWKSLANASRFHEFDYDAVVLYVLRYNMIAWWLGHSSVDARLRFDELVRVGLGDHATLYAGVA